MITHGYGAMYSYEARIPVKQRWAIAAYIRALQYSQDADKSDLSPEEIKTLAAGTDQPAQSNPVDRKSLVEVQK